MSNKMKEKELMFLTIGVVAGMIIAIYCLGGKKTEITTKVKITPEWKLITDGKKIDTIFIYKAK